MNKSIKIALVLISIIINLETLYGQEQIFSKNSIKTGFGIGVSMGNHSHGIGFVYTIGYQREIWKDKLRLNPNFSIGNYSSKLLLDAIDQYFNSINIETNLFYDLIKIKSFSLIIGCGGVINNSLGLKGTGRFNESNENTYSEYINDYHFGGYLGTGFRFNSPNGRAAINLIPINLHFGNHDFAEFHAKIDLDLKF
jgi:hypothetical protein